MNLWTGSRSNRKNKLDATNEQNCYSYSIINILVQKGFQIKGKAEIIGKRNPKFQDMESTLIKITEGKFPFATISKITVTHSKPIIAPKYILYPNTTEKEQIESAKKAYGL
ncbi:hypothetical protein [Winogradskyella flava]|uniref:hypothetical protein n=1 Tax=Winogradskyella flava TaxID=1884876 RepID=UPI00249171FF|nr:hypothetical protein [Winogradskyella flava]